MNVLILNCYDIIGGGAARASYRIHKGLQAIGLNSTMLVQGKYSNDPSVLGPEGKTARVFSLIRPRLDGLPQKLYPHRLGTPWSVSWLPSNITDRIIRLNPDIINLHWICGGFLPVTALAQLNRPLVWTIHDSWAFTGGCHIPFECTRYRGICGSCPQLGSKRTMI